MVILLWKFATGRRPPDLLDIETSDPAQLRLSVDPLPEDKTQLELQRLALRAHQEARQAADLRHDMAKRTMPSMDLTNQVTRFSFGVPLSMLTLLLQRHEEGKMDQRYCYLSRRCYGQCSCFQLIHACQSTKGEK